MGKIESTRFDKIKNNIKNHKVLSIVLLLGAIVIAVASFTDALTTIITFVTPESTQLEVVDILVEPGEKGTVKLDVRIVNNSKKTIIVSRLRLMPLYFEDKEEDQVMPPLSPLGPWTNDKNRTKERMSVLQKLFKKATRWRLFPTRHTPPTAIYEGELTKNGKALELPVAHDLESGKADRFFVLVDLKNLERRDNFAWELDTELVTNVGITSGPRVSLVLPYK